MVHQLRNYTLHFLSAIIAFTLCPYVAKATDAEPGKQVQQSTIIVTDGEKSSIHQLLQRGFQHFGGCKSQ